MGGRGGWLVIGLGNADRGDDGAGAEVVRALAAEGIACIVHEGDGLGLIDAWAGYSSVAIVDAVRGGPEPGKFARFDAVSAPLPRIEGAGVHGVDLAQAIEIARALGRLPRRLVVYAIGASSFVLGEGPAEPVARACAEVRLRIRDDTRLFGDAV